MPDKSKLTYGLKERKFNSAFTCTGNSSNKVVEYQKSLGAILDNMKEIAGRMEVAGRGEIDAVLDEYRSNYRAQTMVSVAIENFKHHAHREKIKLEVELDPAEVFIYIDPERFEMVLKSLLANAARDTPEKGVVKINTTFTGEEYRITIENIGSSASVKNDGEDSGHYRQADWHEPPGHCDDEKEGPGLKLNEAVPGKITVRERDEGGLVFCYAIPAVTIKPGAGQKDFLQNAVKAAHELKNKFQNENRKPIELERVDYQKHILISKIQAYVEDNVSDRRLSLETLSSEFNKSRSTMYRLITSELDMTPADMIRVIRMNKAREYLKNDPELTVDEVAYKVGYQKTPWFIKKYKETFGIHPEKET